MTSPSLPNEVDLDWLAFQYVAGELSPADILAFESRLEHDAAACEAVARVMRTVDALAVSLPTLPVPASTAVVEPARSRARALRLAWVSAACILAALAVWQLDSASRREVASTQQAEVMVSLWTQSEAEVAEVDADDSDADVALDSDLTVPGWMLSAVEAED